ncbi:hypothetical protein cyc_00304 [Cyclospora cayetanensis]|uniref:carnosine N-methyltransferase n=1 Tax=Cyclospora cayetanensis TaxID=88456 RepID=A0A1D3D0J6_9EIME|nr:hypothetical protein cyc_00304 [Cyclospora cayetanensis]
MPSFDFLERITLSLPGHVLFAFLLSYVFAFTHPPLPGVPKRCESDHLDVVWVPDVAPSEHVAPSADFSMCAGEFVEVYGSPSNSVPASARVFDGVLTSFFLDTARNVLVYIKTIAKIVRPGGLWANVGPLLYHYAEMPHEMSVEFSAEEILRVIKNWFNLLKVEWRDCYYTSNNKSMMQYHCLHFVAIRNEKPSPELAPGVTG